MDVSWLGFDWYLAFYPAIRAVLEGQNPYLEPAIIVANPPWTFWILAPLGWLPAEWGLVGINLINITGLLALGYKHNRQWLTLPLALSFPFIALLLWGNVDGLGLWGLALGGPIGLIFLSVKPQLASLVAILWVKKAWEQGGYKAVIQLTAPLLVLGVIMTIMYPTWIERMMVLSDRSERFFANGFPWLIPAGIGMLIAAWRSDREDLAAIATVLIAPHLHIQSWIGALALLTIRYPVEGSIIAITSWIPLIIILTQ
jgi:hypothetical protein